MSQLHPTYSALSSLGAPVTLDEFTQIYKGPLAEILDFLGEHAVGRRGAATARSKVLSLQANSNLQQPRTDADRAVARLGSASKSCEVYGGELVERLAKSAATQAKLDRLKGELARKKRALLLLGMLEAKERVRIGRIAELQRRVRAGEERTVRRVALEPKCTEQLLPAPRVSNVKDCLATLHSLSTRPAEDDATRRLRAVITRRFEEADVERIMNQCISFARGKASPRRDSVDLEAKMKSNEEKAHELQNLVDHSTMLRQLCDAYIASRRESVQSTSPALRQSLREVARSAKGHIDILRAAIVAPSTESVQESFSIMVARLYWMQGNVTVRAILDEVEHVIKRSHRRYSLIAHGQRLPQPVVLSENPIDRSSAHERNTTILSRKADKAVKGRLLADEVEAVLRYSRRVVGIGERSKD